MTFSQRGFVKRSLVMTEVIYLPKDLAG